MNDDLFIGGETVKKGERKQINIPVAKLYDFTSMTIPVEVIRGKKAGPCMFVSAAIHGDEINGVEILRRFLSRKYLNRIKGTLIVVPIVNVFGFNTKSRYLPDRRDLNRSFPGHEKGSLASQLADTFMNEIVSKCTHGIDLHTGAIHRSNLPQIRACLDDPETLEMAKSFNVPVVLHSALRDGSLREAVRELNIPVVLFEGGEALRFNERAIKSGLQGIRAVMRNIGMLPKSKSETPGTPPKTFIARSSYWVRSPHSGILNMKHFLGKHVKRGETLGHITNPCGDDKVPVKARKGGIIIGAATLPLVNEGDAVFHIAAFEDAEAVEESVGQYHDSLLDDNGAGAEWRI